jgi:hypothetical protein
VLRQKKWIAVILCSLALLMAFSVSTGSAHAASSVSHIRSDSSARLAPLTIGPPGCALLVQLQTKVSNFTYEGHSYAVQADLYGWYAELASGKAGFCDQIWCLTSIGGNYPAGNLVAFCNYGSGKTSKRIAGGGTLGSNSIGSGDVAATCGVETWANAAYTPAGGSTNTVPTDYRYPVPCLLTA